MNEETDSQILEELRNLNAQIKKANRMSAVAMALLAVFVAVLALTPALRDRVRSHLQSTAQTGDSWHHARTLLDEGEDRKGREMIERLLLKHPDYYWGHVLMGLVHQEEGNLEATEKSYARAVELFPSEDNEKSLVAIRKAIQKKQESATQSSEAIGAEAAPQPQR